MSSERFQAIAVDDRTSSKMDGLRRDTAENAARTTTTADNGPSCFDTVGCDGVRNNSPLLPFNTSSPSTTVGFVSDERHTSTAASVVEAVAFDFRFIVPLIALVVFNLVVVLGNSLVVAAVFTHRKLRTVTNVFIVSLATSDLLLGLLVLPSSSAYELLGGRWPFGNVWCQSWLAIDVWLCTASILNLCAISLDRYLAISRPFRYPTLMSPRRARIAVALVWTLALAICMPPLLGWRDSGDSSSSPSNSSTASTTTASTRTTTMTSFPAQKPTDIIPLDDEEVASFLEYPDDIYAAASGGITTAVGLSEIDDEVDGFLRRSRRESSQIFPTTGRVLTPFNIAASLGSSKVNESETPLGSSSILVDGLLEYFSLEGRTLSRREALADLPATTTTEDDVSTSGAPVATNGHERSTIDAKLSAHRFEHIDAATRGNRTRLFTPSQLIKTTSIISNNEWSNSTHSYDVAEQNAALMTASDYPISDYPTCALTSDPGYIVYSACGSFWFPMLVMLFFYVRIYRTAIRATNALRRGFVTTKAGSSVGMAASADGSLSLRVHRGGGAGSLAFGKTDSIAWTAGSIRFSNGSNCESLVSGSLSRNVSHGALFTDFRCKRNSGTVRLNEVSAPGTTAMMSLSTQSSCCESASGKDAVIVRRSPLYHEIAVSDGDAASATALRTRRPIPDVVDRERGFLSDSVVGSSRKCSNSTSTVTEAEVGRLFPATADICITSDGDEIRQVPDGGSGCDREIIPTNGVGKMRTDTNMQGSKWKQQRPKHLQNTPSFSRSFSESLATKKRIPNAEPETVTSSEKPSSRIIRQPLVRMKAVTTSYNDCSNEDLDDDDDEETTTSTGGIPRYSGGSVGIEQLLRSALTPVYEHCPAAARLDSVSGHSSSSVSSRRGILNIKNQLRRLNREKKAAKTVGIIVGCFIFCWTPFFSIYVLGAFCEDCTPSIVFSIFFWLGYCNSAINPFVYALCSNDFRDAFRRLLHCNGRIGGGGLPSAAPSSRGSGRRLARDRGNGLAALVRAVGPPQRRWYEWDADRFA